MVEMLLKADANPSGRFEGPPAWDYAAEQLDHPTAEELPELDCTSLSSWDFARVKIIHLLVTTAAALTPAPGFERIW